MGDSVRLISNPTQIGTVTSINRLKVEKGVAIVWEQGPVYNAGYRMAYFGDKCDGIELNA